MHYERSRHYGYTREGCDSYDDRGDYENWDRKEMYDRQDREEFKYSGQKVPDHWMPPDRKYGG